MRPSIRIGRRLIDTDSRPYIIAEVGVNHGGSMRKAKLLIDLAKEGGADAVKFQTYKAGKIASRHSPSYWDLKKEPTRSQYELFKKYDTFGRKEFAELAAHAKKKGIEFLSTPFDDEAVDYLAPLMVAFKIASADITNIPFLRKIASKRKPVILSTGASTRAEIARAIRELESSGASQVALLHCVLNYPTSHENANLGMIQDLKRLYPDKVIGYSDHCMPDEDMMVLTIAYLFGARIIEKHFTYDKLLRGNDHYHAMDVNDLKKFMRQIEFASKLAKTDHKRPIAAENISRLNARRSIVIKRRVKAGTVLTERDLVCKRPGTGISPVRWDDVIGKKAKNDLEEDSILRWSDIA